MGLKHRLSRGAWAALLVLPTLWLFRFTAGPTMSRFAAARLGGVLERLGRGKFNDNAAFLLHRGHEALLLLTAALMLWLFVVLMDRLFVRLFWYRGARGLGAGVLVFAAVNAWVALAAGTALFWIPFFNPTWVDNVVQYEIKKSLLSEIRSGKKAVLLGNSQTRASIKEEILNEQLMPRLWTTELHQPGCNGFGVYLIEEDLRGQPIDFTITCVSEIFAYGRSNGGVIPHFLRVKDLGVAARLNALPFLSPDALRVGLAGAMFPLVRYRDSFTQRVLGGPVANLPQLEFDAARAPSLEEQARAFAGNIRLSGASDFQKQGFELALRRLAGRGCTNLVISCGVHPALRRAVAPEIRSDLAAWLRKLGDDRATTGAVILSEEDFFHGTEEDYADLVHLNEAAQERFSKGLAARLSAGGLPGLGPP